MVMKGSLRTSLGFILWSTSSASNLLSRSAKLIRSLISALLSSSDRWQTGLIWIRLSHDKSVHKKAIALSNCQIWHYKKAFVPSSCRQKSEKNFFAQQCVHIQTVSEKKNNKKKLYWSSTVMMENKKTYKNLVPLISREIGVASPCGKTTLSLARDWEASVEADPEYSPYFVAAPR